MDYDKLLGGIIGTILSATGAGLSVTEVQAIISIIATVIGLLITIITAIVIPVTKKIIEAKRDGKITTDEALDIIDTAEKGIKEVQDKQDKD